MKRLLLQILFITTLASTFALPMISSAQTPPPGITPAQQATLQQTTAGQNALNTVTANAALAAATPAAATTAPAPNTNTATVPATTPTPPPATPTTPPASESLMVTAAGWLSGDIPTLKAIDAVTEFMFLPMASWALGLAGYMLDFSINYTLNFATQVSAAGSSIVLGWTIIRDLFNMSFIFALIFMSIETMLGIGGFQAKNMLKNVIIAALLINFSFFFTQVLIDAGNVVGGWLYQGIETTLQSAGATGPITGNLSISAGLTGALGVYDVYNPDKPSGFLGNLTLSSVTSELISAYVRLAIIIFATYIFAYVAVLFFARTVSLLFMLVLSPIGFAGWILPITKDMADEWADEMKKNILLAPAFLLYLYIILAFVSGPLFASPTLAASTATVFNPASYFKFFLLAAMLLYALEKAKKFSGKLGNMVSGVAKQIASAISGVVLGVVTGGTSAVLQATVGRGAAALAGSGSIKGMIGNDLQKSNNVFASTTGSVISALGKGIRGGAVSTSKQTFDASKTASGMFAGAGATIAVPKSLQSAKEGYVGTQKARKKDAGDTADHLEEGVTKEQRDKVSAARATNQGLAEGMVSRTDAGRKNQTALEAAKIQGEKLEAPIAQKLKDVETARTSGKPDEAARLDSELKGLLGRQAIANSSAEKYKKERDTMIEGKLDELVTEDAKRDAGLATALKATSRVGNYASGVENSIIGKLSATGLGTILGSAFMGPAGAIAAKRVIWDKSTAENKKLADVIRDKDGKRKEERERTKEREALARDIARDMKEGGNNSAPKPKEEEKH